MVTIDERFVEHSRLIRPFPVKRLADVLHQATSYAADIQSRVTVMQFDAPRDPEMWQATLQEIGAALESLADACDEAVPLVEALIRQAPQDYRRAVDGLVATIRGLQAIEAQKGSDEPLAA